MPFVLLVAGIILLIAGVRNTQDPLFALLQADFTGPNNFIFWFIAILIIGGIGYVPKLKPVSDAFLVLVVVVMFLTRGTGFFDQFMQQIKSTESASPLTRGGTSTSSTLASVGNKPGFGLTVNQ